MALTSCRANSSNKVRVLASTWEGKLSQSGPRRNRRHGFGLEVIFYVYRNSVRQAHPKLTCIQPAKSQAPSGARRRPDKTTTWG